jgi:hypothetical protein
VEIQRPAILRAHIIAWRNLSAVPIVNSAHEVDYEKDRKIKKKTKAGTLQSITYFPIPERLTFITY